MLKLDLKTHTYTYDNETLTSVTTKIKEYEPPFNSEYWATREAFKRITPRYKAYKFPAGVEENRDLNLFIKNEKIDPEQLKTVKEAILQEWEDYATIRRNQGINFDDKVKQRARRRAKEPCLFTGTYYPVKDAVSYNPKEFISRIDYRNIPPGAYPDFMVYNMKYKIAGTLDWLFMNEDRTFYVLDLKRYGKLKTRPAKFRPPLSSLSVGAMTDFKLQLWLYSFLLEQFKYKCLNTAVINYNFKGYSYYYFGTNNPLMSLWLDYDLREKSPYHLEGSIDFQE